MLPFSLVSCPSHFAVTSTVHSRQTPRRQQFLPTKGIKNRVRNREVEWTSNTCSPSTGNTNQTKSAERTNSKSVVVIVLYSLTCRTIRAAFSENHFFQFQQASMWCALHLRGAKGLPLVKKLLFLTYSTPRMLLPQDGPNIRGQEGY